MAARCSLSSPHLQQQPWLGSVRSYRSSLHLRHVLRDVVIFLPSGTMRRGYAPRLPPIGADPPRKLLNPCSCNSRAGSGLIDTDGGPLAQAASGQEQQQQQQQQQQQPKGRQLKNRIVFGIGIGVGVAGAVLAGGWVFTLSLSAAVLVATGEYFDLVSSKGIAKGMRPPPVFASRVCSAICAAMPLMTLYFGGRVGVAMTTASFLLAMMLLLQQGIPHFSQLTSAMFGLVYLGYLPSFWIKLRCGLAVPALHTKIADGYPLLLGGPSHWTVGLVATLISFSCIIAADTGAFFGGKCFGKTPLNDVSPKKTLEGAVAGLSSAVLTTVLLSHLLQWPSNLFSAAALALLVFLASLFGDLTESMIKRDAGVKDSGRLIPGHGGILDRTDSYIFTGALVYSFVKIGLPLFGV